MGLPGERERRGEMLRCCMEASRAQKARVGASAKKWYAGRMHARNTARACRRGTDVGWTRHEYVVTWQSACMCAVQCSSRAPMALAITGSYCTRLALATGSQQTTAVNDVGHVSELRHSSFSCMLVRRSSVRICALTRKRRTLTASHGRFAFDNPRNQRQRCYADHLPLPHLQLPHGGREIRSWRCGFTFGLFRTF